MMENQQAGVEPAVPCESRGPDHPLGGTASVSWKWLPPLWLLALLILSPLACWGAHPLWPRLVPHGRCLRLSHAWHRLCWALFGLLLMVGQARAACVAGDSLWVKETVAADTATPTAVFNDSTKPFGLQDAFREVCAGAEIRIVAGANHYNHNSASWNGRDNEPPGGACPGCFGTINIDTVTGNISQYIKVTGWADTTTECTLDGSGNPIAGCPVQLDFDKAWQLANGYFLNEPGIAVEGSRSFYACKFIRISNAPGHGVDFSAVAGTKQSWVWFRSRLDNNGIDTLANPGAANGNGYNNVNGSIQHKIIASEIDHNAGYGIEDSSNDVPAMTIVGNYIHDNRADNFAPGGISAHQKEETVISNVIENNDCNGYTDHNVGADSLFLANTIRLTTANASSCPMGGANDGVGATITQTGHVILWNIFAANDDIGLSLGGTYQLIMGGNYSSNGTNVDPGGATVIFDEDHVLTGGEDQGAVTFTSSTDATPTGGTANVGFYFLENGTVSTFQKGAKQVRTDTIIVSGGGAGGNSAYAH